MINAITGTVGATDVRVFVRLRRVPDATPIFRLGAIGVSAALFTVLVVGFRLTPDARGVGTHEQLGMPACGFVQMFGLPCPTCGFTTSFSLFSHGRLIGSFLNQPAGAILAVLFAVAAWVALYIGVSGKPVHRMFVRLFTPGLIFQAAMILILSWGYKIAMFKLGH